MIFLPRQRISVGAEKGCYERNSTREILPTTNR